MKRDSVAGNGESREDGVATSPCTGPRQTAARCWSHTRKPVHKVRRDKRQVKASLKLASRSMLTAHRSVHLLRMSQILKGQHQIPANSSAAVKYPTSYIVSYSSSHIHVLVNIRWCEQNVIQVLFDFPTMSQHALVAMANIHGR